MEEEITTLKNTIAGLKQAVQNAKEKQKLAKDDIKKLEKDIDEFKNNKEGKIDQLKVRVSFLRRFTDTEVRAVAERNHEAKSSAAETCGPSQDGAEGTTNRETRARYVDPTLLMLALEVYSACVGQIKSKLTSKLVWLKSKKPTKASRR